jgi:hypothetical protein
MRRPVAVKSDFCLYVSAPRTPKVAIRLNARRSWERRFWIESFPSPPSAKNAVRVGHPNFDSVNKPACFAQNLFRLTDQGNVNFCSGPHRVDARAYINAGNAVFC